MNEIIQKYEVTGMNLFSAWNQEEPSCVLWTTKPK
jgi:hypothetical protein